jgi:hypothetical protein
VQNRTGLGNGGGGEEKKKEERRQCAVLVSSPTTQETNHLFALLRFALLCFPSKQSQLTNPAKAPLYLPKRGVLKT